MRTRIVLAIYVSLSTICFGQEPARPDGRTPEWLVIYYLGMDAAEHYRTEFAISLLERSWETAETQGDKGAAAASLGIFYRQKGRLNDARVWLDRALDAWTADPVRHNDLPITASMLAQLDRNAGDYAGAKRVLMDVLQSPSCAPESKVQMRNDLASILKENGETAKARILFVQSVQEATSPREQTRALIGLADAERWDGEWESSIAHWNDALEISRREGDHVSEAVATLGLGNNWLRRGEIARAEPLLRRALRMIEASQAALPEELADAHASLGELYRAENKLALAENEYNSALQTERTTLGPDHPQVASLLQMLAGIYVAQGEFSAAREDASQAVRIMNAAFGPDSMPAAAALTNAATIEQGSGDWRNAVTHYERALEIAGHHPEGGSLRASIVRRYAGLLKSMHRVREASALLTENGAAAKSFRPE